MTECWGGDIFQKILRPGIKYFPVVCRHRGPSYRKTTIGHCTVQIYRATKTFFSELILIMLWNWCLRRRFTTTPKKKKKKRVSRSWCDSWGLWCIAAFLVLSFNSSTQVCYLRARGQLVLIKSSFQEGRRTPSATPQAPQPDFKSVLRKWHKDDFVRKIHHFGCN